MERCARSRALPNLVIAHGQARAGTNAGLHEVNRAAARIPRHAGGPFQARIDGGFALDQWSAIVPARRSGDDSLRHHADSAVAEVRDVQVTRAVHLDIRWQGEAGKVRRAAVSGLDAG